MAVYTSLRQGDEKRRISSIYALFVWINDEHIYIIQLHK